MSCAFCESKEISERMIAENDLAWAFPTNIPITPGHVLVVPKRCVAHFEELNNEEKLAVFDLAEKVKDALWSHFETEGFNHAWNEGKRAGQSVPHFHLHIVPRKENDTGIKQYEPREFLYRPGSREVSPSEELSDIAERLKSELRKIHG